MDINQLKYKGISLIKLASSMGKDLYLSENLIGKIDLLIYRIWLYKCYKWIHKIDLLVNNYCNINGLTFDKLKNNFFVFYYLFNKTKKNYHYLGISYSGTTPLPS